MSQGRQPQAVDYQQSMETFKNSQSEEMFTSQGFIEFAITQKMVPSCRLLLFYVRDDRETVADNMLVDVEDTLENKVKVALSHCKDLQISHTFLSVIVFQNAVVQLTLYLCNSNLGFY